MEKKRLDGWEEEWIDDDAGIGQQVGMSDVVAGLERAAAGRGSHA